MESLNLLRLFILTIISRDQEIQTTAEMGPRFVPHIIEIMFVFIMEICPYPKKWSLAIILSLLVWQILGCRSNCVLINRWLIVRRLNV